MGSRAAQDLMEKKRCLVPEGMTRLLM